MRNDKKTITPLMRRMHRIYIRGVIAIVVVIVCFNAAVLCVYWRDSYRLTVVANELVVKNDPLSVQIKSVAKYIKELATIRRDAYFMLPVFRPLKPTAYQVIRPTEVIRKSGDCAFKARAFIVLLNRLGIEAHKLVLHDSAGEPHHSVAVVKTKKGDLIVDLLFGIIYEHADGTPMSVDYLAGNLETVIREERLRGNMSVSTYPVKSYSYTNVSTINWKKNGLWKALRDLLCLFFSASEIDALPRPYISEEPALIVMFLSAASTVVLMLPFVNLGFTKVRRLFAKKRGTTPALSR